MYHILACDDHAHITRLIELTLMKAGMRVSTCPDGEAGWVFLHEQQLPDLIITDYQMPLLDGLGLCRQLHNAPQFADIPVILLTAKGFEISAPALQRDLGIRAVMVKPFSPRELRANVERLLRAVTVY